MHASVRRRLRKAWGGDDAEGAAQELEALAEKDLVAGSGLVFEDTGEHELKGVPDRWRLYRVVDG